MPFKKISLALLSTVGLAGTTLAQNITFLDLKKENDVATMYLLNGADTMKAKFLTTQKSVEQEKRLTFYTKDNQEDYSYSLYALKASTTDTTFLRLDGIRNFGAEDQQMTVENVEANAHQKALQLLEQNRNGLQIGISKQFSVPTNKMKGLLGPGNIVPVVLDHRPKF